MAQRLFVSTRKGLFLFEPTADGGWRLTEHAFPGDSVTMTFEDPHDRTIYSALNLGHFGVKLRRSLDAGKTWTDVAVPQYPPKPEDEPSREVKLQKPIPWSTQQIWALESGGPGVLWAGTIPGGLFRSRDRGESWELIDALWNREERYRMFGGGYDYPGIHSICVDPRDPNRLTIAVSCGGAWRSSDAGATWNVCSHGMIAEFMPPGLQDDPVVQDPHRMVQSPSNPDVFWVQHHNGVFRSVDDSQRWTVVPNVPPSVFGFAVAVHPKEAETAWFAPAIKDEKRYPVDGKMVITRTRDGGKTFEVLRKGLPQSNAYHLVYRHGLDVDATGDRLAVGSTTGGLWTSNDGGDAWTRLPVDLPPIYAVRFGAP